jgi:hypothetical protein
MLLSIAFLFSSVSSPSHRPRRHLKNIAGKKKVTLELGGNAAVVVHQDFKDLNWLAHRLAFGSFAYAGQVRNPERYNILLVSLFFFFFGWLVYRLPLNTRSGVHKGATGAHTLSNLRRVCETLRRRFCQPPMRQPTRPEGSTLTSNLSLSAMPVLTVLISPLSEQLHQKYA